MTTPDERDARNIDMLQAWDAGRTVSEIAARFGLSLGWVGVVLRDLGAEMPPIRKGVKRGDVDVDEVVGQYLVGGMTVRAIAEAQGASYGTIYRRLEAAGVPMRRRGRGV